MISIVYTFVVVKRLESSEEVFRVSNGPQPSAKAGDGGPLKLPQGAT